MDTNQLPETPLKNLPYTISFILNCHFSQGYRAQGCGVRVAKSRRFLGGVGFLTSLTVGVGFFYLTPEVQLNHFIHCAPKLGNLTRAC